LILRQVDGVSSSHGRECLVTITPYAMNMWSPAIEGVRSSK